MPHHTHLVATQVKCHFQRVSCRARQRRHDGGITTRQGVQQAALACRWDGGAGREGNNYLARWRPRALANCRPANLSPSQPKQQGNSQQCLVRTTCFKWKVASPSGDTDFTIPAFCTYQVPHTK